MDRERIKAAAAMLADSYPAWVEDDVEFPAELNVIQWQGCEYPCGAECCGFSHYEFLLVVGEDQVRVSSISWTPAVKTETGWEPVT